MDLAHAHKGAERFHKATVVLASHAMGLPAQKVIAEAISLPIVVRDQGRIYVLNLGTASKDDDFISPYVVNGAFSLELHLKLLNFYIRSSWPRKHRLAELFDDLPDKIQKDINAALQEDHAASKFLRTALDMLNSKGVIVAWNASELLRRSNDAYVEWRYAFEAAPGCFAGYSELQAALQHQISKHTENSQ